MRGEKELELVRYELPSVVVKKSCEYLGADRLVFNHPTTVVSAPVSLGGLVRMVGLEVDPGAAPHLVVNDVKVGKNSQLVSVGCVPASLFASPTPVRLVLDEVTPGLCVSLNLTCVGPDDVTFSGRILALAPTRARPTPSRRRRSRSGSYVVGCGYTEVGAGATLDVVVFPMVELRLGRLHVPPHLLDFFRVDALFQGRYLDVGQASSVSDPAQLGRESLLRGGQVDMQPSNMVGIGQPVTLRVTNTSGETRYFSGALLGEPSWRDVS
jgi:hypothetical protein